MKAGRAVYIPQRLMKAGRGPACAFSVLQRYVKVVEIGS